MGEKRILDEETRKQLLGYVPFSVDATIDYTPTEYEAVRDESLRPVFKLRSLTQAEVTQLNHNSLGYLKKDVTHEEMSVISEKNILLVRACILGWTNLFDAGTGEEIEYKSVTSGGCDEEIFKRLPGWLQQNIMTFVRQISGLSLAENLSLK